jgi:hypothetical protein
MYYYLYSPEEQYEVHKSMGQICEELRTYTDWRKEIVILLHDHHGKVTICTEPLHEMLEDGQGKDDTGGQIKERWSCIN